jgi:signal transduction histidine kinase
VVNIIKVRLGEKHIRFITNVDRAVPAKLYGDMIRIRQVLLNLLSNAVKYTEKGSIKLTVTGKREGARGMDGVEEILLSFEVADTGYGIKETDMERLFGDFIRFDSHKNRSI